jgi:predicted outer membrane repeat protein
MTGLRSGDRLASRTQVYMSHFGNLSLHDNVVFEANAAQNQGGAVRFPNST